MLLRRRRVALKTLVFESQKFAKYTVALDQDEEARAMSEGGGASAGIATATATGAGTGNEAKRVLEIWRKFSSRWEAWAGGWQARSDP